jgi:ATP-dependent Lhr-like helicase
MLHVDLVPVSPITVIGRERMPQGSVDDQLLIEAESLAETAIRMD